MQLLAEKYRATKFWTRSRKSQLIPVKAWKDPNSVNFAWKLQASWLVYKLRGDNPPAYFEKIYAARVH